MDEQALDGGNSSTVVRVGDAVHRTAGPWTPAVHALLSTLRAAGITQVPEPRGTDDQGREVLSYLPGTPGTYPLPGWLWAPHVLDEAARLLRQVHDASVPLVGRDLVWGMDRREPAEVVCHNDAAPYNMTFVDGHLTGLFDFDTAAPGPRLWDLAYLTYRLAPFTGDAEHLTVDDRLGRADRILAVYGSGSTRDELLAEVVDRLDAIARFTDVRADETGRDDFREHARGYRRDAATVRGLVRKAR